MLNILGDPAWSGIGALTSIAALGLYILIERDKVLGLFPSSNTVSAARQFVGRLAWFIMSIALALLPFVLIVYGSNVLDLKEDTFTNYFLGLLLFASSYGISLALLFLSYVWIGKIFKAEIKGADLPFEIHSGLWMILMVLLGIVEAYRFFTK